MTRKIQFDHPTQLISQESLNLPTFGESLDSTLSQGKSLQSEGTNVVRVPFGIRQPQKQRPQRPESFITLVLPLQPSDSPTPPPQAA
tara:strand:- start:164 stop:424 length:261 start_codon:yes stop_codon:yes gene_type:complete